METQNTQNRENPQTLTFDFKFTTYQRSTNWIASSGMFNLAVYGETEEDAIARLHQTLYEYINFLKYYSDLPRYLRDEAILYSTQKPTRKYYSQTTTISLE